MNGIPDIGEVSRFLTQANKDELNEVIRLIKVRRTILTQQAAMSFFVGDRVSFEHKGDLIIGTVTKVNPKTIIVQPDDKPWSSWKCTATLLTKLDEEEEE